MAKEKLNWTYKGTHIFRFFRMESLRAMEIERKIQALTRYRETLMRGVPTPERTTKLLKIHDRFQTMKEILIRHFLVREKCVENVTCIDGRTVIAGVLAGTYGSTGAVTHCAVGDVSTAPTTSDTQLGNETSRKAISDGNTNGAQTLLETFFGTSEAVDTHEEYGYYIDGTGSANSGELVNHFIEQNIKSNVESMNVQTTIDHNDA